MRRSEARRIRCSLLLRGLQCALAPLPRLLVGQALGMQLQLLHLVLADQRDETEQSRLRQTLKLLPNMQVRNETYRRYYYFPGFAAHELGCALGKCGLAQDALLPPLRRGVALRALAVVLRP